MEWFFFFLGKQMGYMVWEVNFFWNTEWDSRFTLDHVGPKCLQLFQTPLILKARPFLWESVLLVWFKFSGRTTAQGRLENNLNLNIRYHCLDLGNVSLATLPPGLLPAVTWLGLLSVKTHSSVFLLLFQSWNSCCCLPSQAAPENFYFRFVLCVEQFSLVGRGPIWGTPVRTTRSNGEALEQHKILAIKSWSYNLHVDRKASECPLVMNNEIEFSLDLSCNKHLTFGISVFYIYSLYSFMAKTVPCSPNISGALLYSPVSPAISLGHVAALASNLWTDWCVCFFWTDAIKRSVPSLSFPTISGGQTFQMA